MSITLNQLLFICIPSGLALYGAFWLGMAYAEKKLHRDARNKSLGIVHLLKQKEFVLNDDPFFQSDSSGAIRLIENFIKKINLTNND